VHSQGCASPLGFFTCGDWTAEEYGSVPADGLAPNTLRGSMEHELPREPVPTLPTVGRDSIRNHRPSGAVGADASKKIWIFYETLFEQYKIVLYHTRRTRCCALALPLSPIARRRKHLSSSTDHGSMRCSSSWTTTSGLVTSIVVRSAGECAIRRCNNIHIFRMS
jgi:hypothetical protein